MQARSTHRRIVAERHTRQVLQVETAIALHVQNSQARKERWQIRLLPI